MSAVVSPVLAEGAGQHRASPDDLPRRPRKCVGRCPAHGLSKDQEEVAIEMLYALIRSLNLKLSMTSCPGHRAGAFSFTQKIGNKGFSRRLVPLAIAAIQP